ncbi:MAG TPA: ATP-binding cassette domain-containing protein, partial [Arthrobacter sp.]
MSSEERHAGSSSVEEQPARDAATQESAAAPVAPELDMDALAEAGVDQELAEKVAPDRDIAVKVGDNIVEVQNLTIKFGGLVALDNVSFNIKRGEILGLIGPNGAGKTTCFNAMTGVYKPTSGKVVLEGQVLNGIKQHKITRLGLSRTFQNIRLFGEMTALENVVVGLDARHRTSVGGALLRLPTHTREEKSAIERGMALLDFVGIGSHAHVLSRQLPY